MCSWLQMKGFAFIYFQKGSQVPVSPLALKTLRLETTESQDFLLYAELEMGCHAIVQDH